MNLATGIAVYAAICREMGVPLRFPGSVEPWSALHQVTDAGIMGRAVLWALDAATARDQIFNVTNGDNFRWKHLWGDLATFFEIEPAEPQPMSLVAQMADKGPVWERIVARHGLRPTPWEEIAAWPFLDGIMSIGYDLMQSTVKIRQAGFGDCIDTHESFRKQFANLRSLKLLPQWKNTNALWNSNAARHTLEQEVREIAGWHLIPAHFYRRARYERMAASEKLKFVRNARVGSSIKIKC